MSRRGGFRAAPNDAAFEMPHRRLVAQGFAWSELNAYFSARGGVVEQNGGIERIGRTRLHQGMSYFRFVDMTGSDDAKMGGSWWIEYEQLKKIIDARESRGLSLGQMARMFFAVFLGGAVGLDSCGRDRRGEFHRLGRCV